MRWVFSVPFQKWRNAEYWSKPAWGHRLSRGGGEAGTTPTTPCHVRVHMHLRCWLRWVSHVILCQKHQESCLLNQGLRSSGSPGGKTGDLHTTFSIFSLEYTHLIKIGGETSTLHTCTLGVSVLTTQTHGKKIRKDLITAPLKRVSPP